MIFGIYTAYGALNSKPVFEALQVGLKKLGHTIRLNQPGDVDVIWSVLWRGRMQKNKTIWQAAKSNNKPIIVLEVGSFYRGKTWKVGLNGVNRDAYFGDKGNDSKRANKLNLFLRPWVTNGTAVLVACQHKNSGQWEGQDYDKWLKETIVLIKRHTDKQIIVRPHPRYPEPQHLFKNDKRIVIQNPKKIQSTYDDFDFNLQNIYAVFNYSSNPGISAAIQGVPIFVSPSSLAWDVSNTNIKNLNNLQFPEREQWINDLAFTEWYIDEIATGLPILRLTNKL